MCAFVYVYITKEENKNEEVGKKTNDSIKTSNEWELYRTRLGAVKTERENS